MDADIAFLSNRIQVETFKSAQALFKPDRGLQTHRITEMPTGLKIAKADQMTLVFHFVDFSG